VLSLVTLIQNTFKDCSVVACHTNTEYKRFCEDMSVGHEVALVDGRCVMGTSLCSVGRQAAEMLHNKCHCCLIDGSDQMITHKVIMSVCVCRWATPRC